MIAVEIFDWFAVSHADAMKRGNSEKKWFAGLKTYESGTKSR